MTAMERIKDLHDRNAIPKYTLIGGIDSPSDEIARMVNLQLSELCFLATLQSKAIRVWREIALAERQEKNNAIHNLKMGEEYKFRTSQTLEEEFGERMK